MITGDKERKILSYLPIDHCSEGYGYIKPSGQEEFIGIPCAFHSENSVPFIEHRRDGIVIRTINATDVSEIEFEI